MVTFDQSEREFIDIETHHLAGFAATCPPISIRAAKDQPDVTATELNIGYTAAYGGPVSACGIFVRADAAALKIAAQTICKIAEHGWKPLRFMTNVAVSRGSVVTPAGPEIATGMINAVYPKDPTDRNRKRDPGRNQWQAFMAKYMPNAELTDGGTVFGYGVTMSSMTSK